MSADRGVRRPGLDELRLLAKVARMYHEKGIRQPRIASELNLSQARVSRMLKQAVEVGIVHTVVTMPSGVHSDLEDELQGRYGLRDAVVVDTGGVPGLWGGPGLPTGAEGSGGLSGGRSAGSGEVPAAMVNPDEDVLPALGSGAAAYLDMTLTGGHLIGISSWSETLISAVDRMPRKSVPVAEKVVQIVGGLGDAAVQMQATRLTARFAELTGAMPVYLPAPGLVGTPAVRRAMMNDVSVRDVLGTWSQLTDAVVGIGSLEPSPLLQRSGNAVAQADQDELRRLGAVGDVCFRFFDEEGNHVRSTFDQRVIGVTAKELLAVPRRIGVAGGERKYSAIRAALLGGWVNILITDLSMAQRLLAD